MYTPEERTAWRAQREEEKRVTQARIEAALAGECGLEVAVDLSFGTDSMHDREGRSLATQLAFAYSNVRQSRLGTCMHITSMTGAARDALLRRGAQKWDVHRHEEGLLEALAPRGKGLVFLTPDSPNVLETVDRDKIYVIGGIVDKSVRKGESLQAAQRRGLETARLPVRENLGTALQEMARPTTVLTINAAVLALIRYTECHDWRQAILAAIRADTARPE